MDCEIADALAPVAVDTAYSYCVPEGMRLALGDLVEIPLGSRRVVGVVWNLRREAPRAPLKSVIARLDAPALGAPLRDFIDWVARWTLSPRGMALRMAIRAAAFAPEPPRLALRLTGVPPRRLTPARGRILAALADGVARSRSDVAARAACSAGAIQGLVNEGALEIVALPPAAAVAPPDPGFAPPRLEPAQCGVVRQLADCAEGFSTTLLEGVTGSGKTEVAFEAVAACLRSGRQALVLMPEIALTAQFLDRFAARFGALPAEWHSGVGERRRARLWRAVAEGEAQAVVGARSALFLPFKKLGLIVVDEEHDGAYKQDDGVCYHARDMAIVRAQLESCPAILASATPSLESRVNAEAGRYRRARLTARYGGRPMPAIAAVDLRAAPSDRGRWLSPILVQAIADALARREQALLFLNRRGYAPLTLCRACGHRFQCPNCTAWLVEHRFRRQLVCHHCGREEPRPDVCPQCEEEGSLTACGPGVERLGEEVAALFPDARTMVLSSDLVEGADRLRQQFETVARGAVDIVIGTQLVAKGHNFPRLTLVGVVDADIGLANGDPRAAERTFQLLQQVSGRAGRGDRPGRALIQTWQPDHPVIRALVSGDAERFYDEETQARRNARLPPFGRLAAIIVAGRDRAAAQDYARALARAGAALACDPRWRVAPASGLADEREITLLGPAEAPIAIVRGRHRFRLLARAPRSARLQDFLRALIAAAPAPTAGTRAVIDVDPQSFL